MSIGGGFRSEIRLAHYRGWKAARKSVHAPAASDELIVQKGAATLWGKGGRARTGLGRGGVGM